MKKEHFIISGLLIIIAVLLFFQQCDKLQTVYVIPKIDTKPLQAQVKKSEHRADSLQHRSDSLGKASQKVRHHWHMIKHDSLIPVPVLINLCDSVLAADSIHSVEQDKTIAAKDSVIGDLKELQAAKDMNHSIEKEALRAENKGLQKDLRKQKWIKRGIITAWLLREGAGIMGR